MFFKNKKNTNENLKQNIKKDLYLKNNLYLNDLKENVAEFCSLALYIQNVKSDNIYGQETIKQLNKLRMLIRMSFPPDNLQGKQIFELTLYISTNLLDNNLSDYLSTMVYLTQKYIWDYEEELK